MRTTKLLDKRRQYYLVLDCETATLPCANKYNAEQKKKIAIAKPLIYDLAWQIIDKSGKVYRKRAYLITEIFSVPEIFNTAYYASKRPLYIDKLNKGEIELTSWKSATEIFIQDLEEVCSVGAYNSMFDFKKAIPFTEYYIKHLYSADFHEWLGWQSKVCDDIAEGRTKDNEREFNQYYFEFRNKSYKLFDIWGLSCENILNCDEFKSMCRENEWSTASGKYYPTNAEKTYAFLTDNTEFNESHTATEDTEIECEILAEVFRRVKPKNMTMGIIYFPFRILGRIEESE